MDEAIVNRVRRNHDFLIGRLTAETLRKEFGIFDDASDHTLSVAGRNLISGVPTQYDVCKSSHKGIFRRDKPFHKIFD